MFVTDSNTYHNQKTLYDKLRMGLSTRYVRALHLKILLFSRLERSLNYFHSTPSPISMHGRLAEMFGLLWYLHYLSFPWLLFFSALHNVFSDPLAAFPYNYHWNNGQQWERTETYRDDFHQSTESFLAKLWNEHLVLHRAAHLAFHNIIISFAHNPDF